MKSVKKTCPKPYTFVRFDPTSGRLKMYQRHAKEMHVKPLKAGDIGLVRGCTVPEYPGELPRVVVEMTRTQRFHEIDSDDLAAFDAALVRASRKR